MRRREPLIWATSPKRIRRSFRATALTDPPIRRSADPRDYYRFEITETRSVGIGLRQLDRNAHVYLEDQNQNVLASSENAGLANEWIAHDLQPGTYFVRVEAMQGGDNDYVFRYAVGRP